MDLCQKSELSIEIVEMNADNLNDLNDPHIMLEDPQLFIPTKSQALVQLRHLSFQDIELLQQLWVTRTLTTASEKVGLSIPAASRRLGGMRQAFKDELFIRAGHEMLPTARMRNLIELIQNFMQCAERMAENEKEFDLANESRTVRIDSTDNVVPAFLSPMLKNFYNQAPNANVSVCHVDDRLLERLRTGQTDMAMMVTLAQFPADFQVLELYHSDFAVMVRKDHPLASRENKNRALTVDELEQYRAVKVVTPDSPVHLPLPLRMETGFATPYFLTVPEVLAQTDFVYVGPEVTLQWLRETSDLGLVILKAPDLLPHAITTLVWHQSTHRDPFMQWVRGVLTFVTRTEARRLLGRPLPGINASNSY